MNNWNNLLPAIHSMQGEGRRGMEAGVAASLIELTVDEITEEYVCGVVRVLRAPSSLHDISCMDMLAAAASLFSDVSSCSLSMFKLEPGT
ncbi:hypothetical protein MRB53_014635 [Persea americana]|uniref:Uncharacterized protein n=1 Tax=Persea americana TaxID=3435 RepID=A0ACC2KBV0_PERAE|nr:hypothetical protein MRB53_014635 [Persea americana]